MTCVVLGMLAAAGAGTLTAHAPDRQFPNSPNTPPMRPRMIHADGRIGLPFVYPVRLVDRLERRYAEDHSRPRTIRWFVGGRVASIDEADGPWFPLGADPLGRDVLSRLLFGARTSLGVAVVGSIGALGIGLLFGGIAGYLGGRVDRLLMSLADFIIILPAIYVVLAVRAALPLVLSSRDVFLVLSTLFAVVGWPIAARGVRAIVAAERQKEYAEAAHALGAGPFRILLRHLIPPTLPFLLSLWTMIMPAFVLTEATLSFVGLGFPAPTATWGAMLRDAWQAAAVVTAPWLLSPLAAIVLTVLALHLVTADRTVDGSGAGTFL